MNILNRCLSALVATAIASTAALADGSSVWKATKGDTTVYLGGSFHLLSASDHPLPPGYDQAFAQADEIYFETDLSVAGDPGFQMQMMQVLLLDDGQTLEKLLKPETYSALKSYLKERGLPLQQFARFTPTGVSLTLTVVELSKMGMVPELGVDQTYYARAQNENKPTGALETPEEQLAYLAGLGEDQADQLILSTLEQLDALDQQISTMKAAWLTGDMQAMDELGNEMMRDDFPAAYQALIVERNQNWMEDINQMLADDDTEMVLVGTLHMAGPDGLLARLKGLGFQLEQL